VPCSSAHKILQNFYSLSQRMPLFSPRLKFVAFVVDSLLSFPFLTLFSLLFIFCFYYCILFPFILPFLVLPSMLLFSSFSYFCVLLLFVIFLQNKYFFLFDVYCLILHALYPKSVLFRYQCI